LVKNGGTEVALLKDEDGVPSLNIESITHIIAADIEFTQFSEIERRKLEGEIDQRMLPIITPAWVTESLNRNRILHVRAFNADPRFFFSGVDVYTADLPDGDKEAIVGGVLALGGQYRRDLSKITTHIVALSLENVRI
jgi:hypothetical protein